MQCATDYRYRSRFGSGNAGDLNVVAAHWTNLLSGLGVVYGHKAVDVDGSGSESMDGPRITRCAYHGSHRPI